jgi:hypothetical protein
MSPLMPEWGRKTRRGVAEAGEEEDEGESGGKPLFVNKKGFSPGPPFPKKILSVWHMRSPLGFIQ